MSLNLQGEPMEPKVPNLFRCATTELSQDAFLLWLLEWANPSNAKFDPALHATAVDFVHLLLDDAAFDVKRIRCIKQWLHIDVLAIVNDSVSIIIEDKINAVEHGNQISRYREELRRHEGIPKDIRCVYLKTGNECRSIAEKKAASQSYKCVWRGDFLKLLERSESKNVILLDFIEHLEGIEAATESYRTKPYQEWDAFAWQGLYLWFERQRDSLDWRYISNPQGGFWGLNWHWKYDKPMSNYGFWIHLQIEQGKICVRAYNESQKPTAAKILACRDKINEYAKRHSLSISLPRLHRGRSCALCSASMDKFFPNNRFDEKKFLECIGEFERLVDALAE